MGLRKSSFPRSSWELFLAAFVTLPAESTSEADNRRAEGISATRTACLDLDLGLRLLTLFLDSPTFPHIKHIFLIHWDTDLKSEIRTKVSIF